MRIGSCGSLDKECRAALAGDRAIGRDGFRDREPRCVAASRPGALRLRWPTLAEAATGHHACPMVSSDVFYHADPLGRFAKARARGVLACDMETASIYGMAARFGARALSICTVVDSLVTGEEIDNSERQEVFGPMAELALDTLAADWKAGAVEPRR